AADCPASPVSVVLGGSLVTVQVPLLTEGGLFERSCQELLPGYAGTFRATCLGSLRWTQSCAPQGCPEGQLAPLRIGDSAELLPAATRGLAHRKAESLPCRDFRADYLGYVHLRCLLGVLSADGATCRPRLQGVRSAYRVVSTEFLPGAWRVFELSFHSSPECAG
ncbi:unnamed protein product, partial [Effrenium voratum]